MAESIVAITGSTGALGGRVAARLAERGMRQRLIVRDAAKAPQLDAEIAIASSTVAEAYAARASYGAPKFEVDGWVTSYLAIAAGELNVVPAQSPQS